VRLIHQTVHKCFQGLFFAATTSCTAVFRENPSNKRVTKHPIFGYISLHINRSHNILSTGGEIKSLLIGMLACTALVGCTSDDVIDNGGNEQQEVATRGETYISLSFTSKTDSSRGTAGDTDGTADDSNHHVVGTTQENAINSVLVIISEKGTAEAYKDYGLKGTDNSFINGYVRTYSANELQDETVAGDKALPENLRVDYQSDYKALVVINPVEDLMDAVKALGQNHAEAYKKVCEYKGLGIEGDLFMMSNKEEALIQTSEANRDPENPASTVVNVERAASKITFRHSDAPEGAPTALASKKDVHKIDVTIKHYVAETANFWYHREAAPTTGGNAVTTYYYAILNKATVDGQTYWVLLKNGADLKMEEGDQLDPSSVDGVFTYDGTSTYTGAISVNGGLVQQPGNLLTEIPKDEALIRSMTFVQKPADPASTPTEYFVHLEDYALVNYIPTTDMVYAVRHITKDYTTTKVMGALGSEYPYLVDPNSTAKNAGTFTGFTNKASEVNTAVEAWRATPDTKPAVFSSLASVVDDGISTNTTTSPHSNYTVGSFMTYCYENAFTADASTVGNVTGIVLAGQIYDKDGNAVPVMYKYNGNFYRTLRHLLNTLEGVTPTYTKNNVTYTLTENTSDADADLVDGLDVYVDGKCYYYSAGIKHYEGTDPKKAEPMEYAIMRNNIYSLAVTGINAIGSADLKLESGASVIDQSAYVTLEVSILPWIVRFNNINF